VNQPITVKNLRQNVSDSKSKLDFLIAYVLRLLKFFCVNRHR